MTFVWKLINMHIDSYGEQARGMEVGVVIKPLPPANYTLTSPLPQRHMGKQYITLSCYVTSSPLTLSLPAHVPNKELNATCNALLIHGK